MKHQHNYWQLVCSDALGVYRKQEGQDNDYECRGIIEACGICQVLRLVPHDPALRTVEVERAA